MMKLLKMRILALRFWKRRTFGFVSYHVGHGISGVRVWEYGLGITGIGDSFHSTKTNNMASRPPMVSMEITSGESQAYVLPPPLMGI